MRLGTYAHVLSAIKVVVMDIDGTLVSGPHDTLENITRQLRRLRAANIRFTVATGRTLAGARSVVERLLRVRMLMPPMVAHNERL
jgi:hydroxymethylpyrimidine pyrophosphatase-like HAD family hydrolase